MKLIFLLLTYFVVHQSYPIHDIQIAHFKIHQEESTLLLEIRFEKEDISFVLETAALEITKKQLQSYLNAQTEFKFDGEYHPIVITTLKSNADHLTVLASFDNKDTDIKTIELINECLLDIEGHSNIIAVRIQNQERDFLMNSDRTSITVKL